MRRKRRRWLVVPLTHPASRQYLSTVRLYRNVREFEFEFGAVCPSVHVLQCAVVCTYCPPGLLILNLELFLI